MTTNSAFRVRAILLGLFSMPTWRGKRLQGDRARTWVGPTLLLKRYPTDYHFTMKPLLLLLLALSLSAFSQTKPNPCPNKSEMQEEVTETKSLVARMQNRIVVMRNAAGTVSDFEVRNALQVNADSWQDLLESLKHRLDRLQTEIERCDAREKIESVKPK